MARGQEGNKIQRRLDNLKMALDLQRNQKVLEGLVNDHFAAEFLRQQNDIAFDSGELLDILTMKRHQKRDVTVSPRKVTITVDHGGAKYQGAKVMPQVLMTLIVSRAVGEYLNDLNRETSRRTS